MYLRIYVSKIARNLIFIKLMFLLFEKLIRSVCVSDDVLLLTDCKKYFCTMLYSKLYFHPDFNYTLIMYSSIN